MLKRGDDRLQLRGQTCRLQSLALIGIQQVLKLLEEALLHLPDLNLQLVNLNHRLPDGGRGAV